MVATTTPKPQNPVELNINIWANINRNLKNDIKIAVKMLKEAPAQIKKSERNANLRHLHHHHQVRNLVLANENLNMERAQIGKSPLL